MSHEKILKQIGQIADREKISVYAVGGYVRDQILKKETKEIDFVVGENGPLFAKKVKQQLHGHGLVVYEQFGTASLIVDDVKLEFVTAREERYEKESRKPIIEKSDILSDLERRDFTINTLALGINKDNFGKILDPFGGLKDMKAKTIRTPLDPDRTFSDDPLRILRAARFASQLSFRVNPQIIRSMENQRERLKIVSQERITDELFRILSHPRPSVGFQILKQTHVLDIVFPELIDLVGIEQRDTYHHKDVFEHTMKVVDNLARISDNPRLRFVGLIHDIGKPRVKQFVEGTGWTFHGHELVGERLSKKICNRLKLPKEYRKYSQKLIHLHMRPIQLIGEEVTDSAIRRLIVQAGEKIDDLMKLCRADITSGNPKWVKRYLNNFEYLINRMKEVEEKDRIRAFQSPVRGEEIMEVCGIGPGPLVGKLKSMIEEAILEGQVKNEHDAAYRYLMTIKDDVLSHCNEKADTDSKMGSHAQQGNSHGV
ncbi:HD domain-containing protein [bacterium]|nr:HD domain-containing protein [bacterium]